MSRGQYNQDPMAGSNYASGQMDPNKSFHLYAHSQQDLSHHGHERPVMMQRPSQEQIYTSSAIRPIPAHYAPMQQQQHQHQQGQRPNLSQHLSHNGYDTTDAQAAALAALSTAGTIDPLSLQRFVGYQTTLSSNAPVTPSDEKHEDAIMAYSSRDARCAQEALALLIPSAEMLTAYSSLPEYLMNQPPLGSIRPSEADGEDQSPGVGSSSGRRPAPRKRGRPPRTLPPSPPQTASLLEFPTDARSEQTGVPQAIPAAYIREQVRTLKESWMNRDIATHNLFIRAQQPAFEQEEETFLPATRLYPIHEMVLVSQLAYWQLLCRFSPAREEGWMPIVEVEVPQPDFIDPLMHWLHHHDDQALYEMLDEMVDSSAGWIGIVWFARNVRSLGVCDSRVRIVLEAVVHERFGSHIK
ncbi:hypothetical protein BCR37DRAFT_376140 [Protomyces lactucae-debilis]|uniref:Uncharacterized protein n=1 Tax=Protomyces lactucae-debilis TaxID=2754530 RepID=A0A1Y2FS71_PROLT|nr:uncharacterized protein BCR37DRAFT_376140 [Protomyces lactucae-debilis]ORY86860.1 hypothetical protein BCR37DRAFT_376140 [Protomyces lactucae-debilis]